MEWDRAARCEAVGAWQDRHLLALWQAMNAAATAALLKFDALVPEAGWHGSWFDRTRYTAEALDAPMLAAVRSDVRKLLARARQDLLSIDPNFASLSAELRHYGGAKLPKSNKVASPAKEGEADMAAAPSSAWWNVLSYPLSAAQSAGEAVGSSVRYVTGIHAGLRQHARAHLEQNWLGNHQSDGEPASVLAQVEATIRQVANQAKALRK